MTQLPPLPPPKDYGRGLYTAAQMLEYARMAVAPQSHICVVPVAEVGDLVIEVRERVMVTGFKSRDSLYTLANSVL